MAIKRELSIRNKTVNDISKGIIKQYESLFNELFDKMVNSRMNVRWVGIDFHQHNTLLLSVIGVAKYNPGEVIGSESNDVVYIDETNADNYSRPMLIIIPTHLVEARDIKGLLQFVTEYSELARESSTEELELMLADDSFLQKMFTAFKDISTQGNVVVDEHEGFDLTKLELDDIQMQQLKLMRIEGQS